MQRVVGCLLLPGSLLRRPLNGSWGRKRDVSTPAATGVCSLVNWLARQMPTKRAHTPTQTHKHTRRHRKKRRGSRQHVPPKDAAGVRRERQPGADPSLPHLSQPQLGEVLVCGVRGRGGGVRRLGPLLVHDCRKRPPGFSGYLLQAATWTRVPRGAAFGAVERGGGDGGEAETRVRGEED